MTSCYAWVSSLIGSSSSETSSTGSPLPRVEHVSLPLTFLKKRLVIVGDIHGCLDELKRLLEKVRFDPETTTVVSIGDTIVKGPDSVGVVRFIRSLPAGSFFVVRGNHEDNALLARFKLSRKFSENKKFRFVEKFTVEEVEWLKQLPISISISELALLIVHAGLDPSKIGQPVCMQKFSELIRIRWVDTEGRPLDKKNDDAEKRLWASMYQGPPLVVFGHDAKRKLQVHPWARGLDTGCVYGGSLTALVIEDTRDTRGWMEKMEIVSVPAARVYCAKDDD